MTKPYSLRKCHNLYKDAVLRHKKLLYRLSNELMSTFEHSLEELDSALQAKDIEKARVQAHQLEQFLKDHGKKTFFEHAKELVVAILLALLIAAVVRQMWFELYEIPTGSMRPTFRESDRVFVFKDAYCINVPFQTAHFLFQPELVRHGNIVVITGDNLDLPDVDTVYFGIFPGKRRYVKRCIGKGGDTLYFYGGKVYGIDKEGKPIWTLLDSPYFAPLEHIPFITFEGKVDQKNDGLILRHMNIPVAQIEMTNKGQLIGKMLNTSHQFGELWGIQNYGISRLLEPNELPQEAKSLGYTRDDAKLYLEIKHHPELPSRKYARNDGSFSLLNTSRSWLALDATHIKTLVNSLYTARFYVHNGTAFRYTPEGPDFQSRGVFLDKTIPNGCYEFIDGVALEIGAGAITYTLPPNHPIYPQRTKMVKTLYNSGIELFSLPTSSSENAHFPSRYTYFRDQTLYTLGKPLVTKDDLLMQWFLDKEQLREKQTTGYRAFKDMGAPMKDGTLDVAFIKEFGLPIQDQHYLLLGDNHAMSNDSRFFGTVPEQNLQGSTALMFWPPGQRWGRPEQPDYPFFRASNIFVLSASLIGFGISFWYLQRRTSRKSFQKRKNKRLKG